MTKGRRQRFRNLNASVERRILDAVIYTVHERGWRPKSIVLTANDMVKLPMKHRYGYIDGMPVRLGRSRSAIFCHGRMRVLI